MANVNAPFGLRPVMHLDGSAWNGAARMYYIPSSDTNAYYIGDVVQSAAGGDTVTGASTVILSGTRASSFTSGNVRGVVVGLGAQVTTPGGSFPGQFDPANLNISFIPATKSQNYYVWVCDDPNTIFEIQANNNVIAASGFNKNYPFTPTVTSNTLTTTGGVLTCGTILGAGAGATTSTLPLKLLGGKFQPDNDLTAAYAVWYVKINAHELGSVGTAGV